MLRHHLSSAVGEAPRWIGQDGVKFLTAREALNKRPGQWKSVGRSMRYEWRRAKIPT